MHDIEPHFTWRDDYIDAEDDKSPFYGREYSEFMFSNRIYNYYIHPQWDEFGSATLYMKILYVDYEDGFAIIELMGEWNDCLKNDIMYLKRNIADHLIAHGVNKFILICEHVLNFHGDDDDYYQEWYQDIAEEDGWIALINTLDHVSMEMNDSRLHNYIHFGSDYNGIAWRPLKPQHFCRRMYQVILESETPKYID